MKVPSQFLRQQLTIEPYLGAGAYGPRFGDAFTVPARVEGRRRAVRKADGTDVISSATAIVRPDVSVPIESRASVDDRTYEVLDVLPGEGLSRPAFYELVLS